MRRTAAFVTLVSLGLFGAPSATAAIPLICTPSGCFKEIKKPGNGGGSGSGGTPASPPSRGGSGAGSAAPKPVVLTEEQKQQAEARAKAFQSACLSVRVTTGQTPAECRPAAPAPAGSAPAPETPGEAAVRIMAKVDIPKPVAPEGGPAGVTLADGRPYTAVNTTTWFWVDQSSWQSVSDSENGAGMWVEVNLEPTRLRLSPGDGSPDVTCTGPGTAWTQGTDPLAEAPGGCHHIYKKAGNVNATISIDWHATWTASGGQSGDFGTVTSSTPWNFTVVEGQALVES